MKKSKEYNRAFTFNFEESGVSWNAVSSFQKNEVSRYDISGRNELFGPISQYSGFGSCHLFHGFHCLF